MEARVERVDEVARVAFAGRLTFGALGAFRKATEPLLEDPGVAVIHLDLGGVSHMDASSLGMLLVLREKAEARGRELEISALAPCASVLLESVHFQRLFRIVK